MSAATMGTSLVPLADRFVFADGEQLALVGFLAGYRGATRDAYRTDLRLFAAWCAQHDTALFEVQRVDIECYARQLEARGRERATLARRLCTVAGFYRYAEQEGLIERSPAVHVRRPRLDYESHAVGVDRNELGALLVAAGLAGAREHALISLLGLNGLRISEALGVDIDELSVERGPVARNDRSGAACRPSDRALLWHLAVCGPARRPVASCVVSPQWLGWMEWIYAPRTRHHAVQTRRSGAVGWEV